MISLKANFVKTIKQLELIHAFVIPILLSSLLIWWTFPYAPVVKYVFFFVGIIWAFFVVLMVGVKILTYNHKHE